MTLFTDSLTVQKEFLILSVTSNQAKSNCHTTYSTIGLIFWQILLLMTLLIVSLQGHVHFEAEDVSDTLRILREIHLSLLY